MSRRDPSDANPAGLDLREAARLAAMRRLPPVHLWNPPHCGHSGMRILRDGSWIHDGSPIRRPELVRLFSSILRREPDGGFVLVTPVERMDIDVEDAPFVAIDVENQDEGKARMLAFRLLLGETVIVGPDHPIRIRRRPEGDIPYVEVRAGLEARLARPVYYRLAEQALEEGAEPLGLWSDGAFFALERDS